MSNRPIGIFDSGVGGLSVWREVVKLMPNENIVYLADSKNCPYGPKPAGEIIDLSKKNVEFLLNHNCKVIIVACNTATAAAIDTLRSSFSVPFVGMEPAIKPAAINTNTGKIGLLATKGTFDGRLFKETSTKFASHINKIVQVGDGLVELVESGRTDSDEATKLLKKYINPMIDAGVDQIVLGCTHYPFLKTAIEKFMPRSVRIIDPSPAIAAQTKSIVLGNKVMNNVNNATYSFFTTGNPALMQKILEGTAKMPNPNVEKID